MRLIIAGSRGVVMAYKYIVESLEENNIDRNEIECIISGTARGVDKVGEDFAADNMIYCERYPADWDKHGKAAGYIRNTVMAENADALLAIWDGESRGTKHMIDIATKKGLTVYIKEVDND